MDKIIKTGKRLQFRQAEEKDMDYIMETEYFPEIKPDDLNAYKETKSVEFHDAEITTRPKKC